MSVRRILVVEDEVITAMDIAERLAALGYQVAGRAVSGEQGVQMAAQAAAQTWSSWTFACAEAWTAPLPPGTFASNCICRWCF